MLTLSAFLNLDAIDYALVKYWRLRENYLVRTEDVGGKINPNIKRRGYEMR